VVKGMYHSIKANGDEAIKKPATIGRAWFGNPLARLNFHFKPSENMEVLFGFEGNIFVCTFPPNLKTKLSSNGGIPVFPQWMDWRIHQAQGVFSLLNSGATTLRLSLGLMPYKYNPEVRNLGEFLFRSGTYPFFLVNNFNLPLQRLSGLRLNYKYTAGTFDLTFDQFILTERNFAPLNDISLASVVGIDLMKMVSFGLGVDFDRIITLNSNLTTPKQAKYVKTPGDTGLYTFKGTKVMARTTVDPFSMMRNRNASFVNELLGNEGGKIYGEVAVIGLKDYPVSHEMIDGADSINLWGYTRIQERMPAMFGIMSPTHPFITYGLYPELAVILFEKSNLHRFLFGDKMKPYVSLKLPKVKDKINISNHLVFGFFPAAVTLGGWALDKHLGSKMNWIKKIGLDEVSYEMEYYPAPYPNDYYQAFMNQGLPIPTWISAYHNDTTEYNQASYRNSPWYWSLYMKKQVIPHCSLFGQIARDHMRWDVNLGNENNYDTEQIMAKTGQWAWRTGILFEF
jgi:hypothetical protein